MSKIVNRHDLDFLMYDVLHLEKVFETEKYNSFDREAVTAILDSAEKIAEEKFLPCAAEVDAFEPLFEEGRAITHKAIKPALDAYIEAGFLGAGFDEDVGGLQSPVTVQMAVNGLFYAANMPAFGYAALTIAAANMLNAFGSDEQKAIFLEPLLEGRFFGTMCLSEPHAGSSLADIRTKAIPQNDGTYSITGTKMWISGGEQDISENIVHFVLAKIPGGPSGVKGISLFIVPKVRVGDNGDLLQSNDIVLAGLNHKMGNRGTTNTLLNFGEQGECVGYLLGKPHHGLQYMFHMMNEARIGVGHGATMLGLAGYLHSLDYAKERLQGRHPTEKNPETPQVPIIKHADVKRLLLAQKAAVEGAMCFILYCAKLVDEKAVASDESTYRQLVVLLDLLTPVAKSWPSEFCLEANKHAIQILGGAGYTKDHPVERLYRDNRLNPIHEGAHAIHGIDILGRKVRMGDGAAMDILKKELEKTVEEAKSVSGLDDEVIAFSNAVEILFQTTAKVIAEGDPDRELANATLFLDAFGHIMIAWMWLRQGVALKSSGEKYDSSYISGKLRAMKYFYAYELPRVNLWLDIVGRMEMVCADMEPEEFLST